MRRASDVLQEARALIADRRFWCKWHMQLGEKRCAEGALCAANGEASYYDEDGDPWSYLCRGADVVGRWEVSAPFNVNDAMGHAAVIQMYDVAISMALSDEAANDR